MYNHHEVCRYLQTLGNTELREVGEVLGVDYNILRRLNNNPDDVVTTWLRQEVDYMTTGVKSTWPTWRRLIEALRIVGRTDVAINIEQDHQN